LIGNYWQGQKPAHRIGLVTIFNHFTGNRHDDKTFCGTEWRFKPGQAFTADWKLHWRTRICRSARLIRFETGILNAAAMLSRVRKVGLFHYLEQINKDQLQRYFLKRLQRLGLNVTVCPPPLRQPGLMVKQANVKLESKNSERQVVP
jgi:hypothetical protein